jgi:branched-chain amino acid transport system ATP-binding protein
MSEKRGLVLEDVRAGYGETIVLDGVTLALEPGDTLAVLGRNGVGKTTLMQTIMGHADLHAGRIAYAGADLTHLAAHRRAGLGLGLVPQERDIFASLSVEENLTVGARAGRWDLARIYDLFPQLRARRENRGNHLSGGEQQMLSVARALMGNPSLLLLDEPLEGLAPVIVDGLMRAFETLRREENLAIVLVEQRARLALEFARRAVVLDRGRVVHDGESSDLLGAPDRLAALLTVGTSGSDPGV